MNKFCDPQDYISLFSQQPQGICFGKIMNLRHFTSSQMLWKTILKRIHYNLQTLPFFFYLHFSGQLPHKGMYKERNTWVRLVFSSLEWKHQFCFMNMICDPRDYKSLFSQWPQGKTFTKSKQNHEFETLQTLTFFYLHFSCQLPQKRIYKERNAWDGLVYSSLEWKHNFVYEYVLQPPRL